MQLFICFLLFITLMHRKAKQHKVRLLWDKFSVFRSALPSSQRLLRTKPKTGSCCVTSCRCLRFCRPADSFFLCPLFIIYIRASIVMRCHSNRLLHRTLLLARTPGGENIFPLPWPRLSMRAHKHDNLPLNILAMSPQSRHQRPEFGTTLHLPQ